MHPDLQRRVQRYGWDKAAEYYDDSWEKQLEPARDKLLDTAALKPGEKVLETACGTGLVTFPAAEAVQPGGEVTAIDLSELMIEIGRERMDEQKIRNVRFQRMDAENLEAEDRSFDAVLCSLGLMYLPDPVQSLKEMYRVLKPGGRAVSSVWGERKNCGWKDIFPIVDKRVASDVCPLFFKQGTGSTLEQSYLEAGFDDYRSERFSVSLRYPNPEEALTAAFYGGAVALAYNKFDRESREEAHREYLDSIAPFRKGNGYEIPGEFVVGMGRKR